MEKQTLEGIKRVYKNAWPHHGLRWSQAHAYVKLKEPVTTRCCGLRAQLMGAMDVIQGIASQYQYNVCTRTKAAWLIHLTLLPLPPTRNVTVSVKCYHWYCRYYYSSSRSAAARSSAPPPPPPPPSVSVLLILLLQTASCIAGFVHTSLAWSKPQTSTSSNPQS